MVLVFWGIEDVEVVEMDVEVLEVVIITVDKVDEAEVVAGEFVVVGEVVDEDDLVEKEEELVETVYEFP
jgi:hypothetical protein